MSERLTNHETKHENTDLSAEVQENLARIQELARKSESQKPDIERLQQKAKLEAKEKSHVHLEKEVNHASSHVSHTELKKHAYARTLHRIRSHLSPTERSLSLLIHRPAVEKVSNATAATVARPYPIIFGATAAIIGSSILLYMAKKYGFSYNYSVVLMTFVGGYIIGVACELVTRTIRNKN